MKNRKKFNELYRGLFNQEKKSSVPLADMSRLNHSNRQSEKNDQSSTKLTINDDKHKLSEQTTALKSCIKQESTIIELVPITYSKQLSKINRLMKNNKLYLLKRQYLGEVFTAQSIEYESIFDVRVTSLFQKKESRSCVKEGQSKLIQKPQPPKSNSEKKYKKEMNSKPESVAKLNLAVQHSDFKFEDFKGIKTAEFDAIKNWSPREETKVKINYKRMFRNNYLS